MIQGLAVVLLIVLLLIALMTAHETNTTKKRRIIVPTTKDDIIEPKTIPQETAPKTAVNTQTALPLPLQKSETVITAELGPPLSSTSTIQSADLRSTSKRFSGEINMKQQEVHPLTNRRHHSRHRAKGELPRRSTTRVN